MHPAVSDVSHAPPSIHAKGEASRDLQITGATRKDASWQYHIEVLDVRASTFINGNAGPSVLTLNARRGSNEALDAIVADDQKVVYLEMPPVVRYTVMRRYSDFRQLYTFLVESQGAALREALPKFPDGGWLSFLRGDDPKLLHHRRERLQRFLRAVDARPELRWSAAFTKFLRPDFEELAYCGPYVSLPPLAKSPSFVALSNNSSEMDSRLPPPAPLSAPSSLPPPRNLVESCDAPMSSVGGYVSLSQLKSPEIRFRKKPVPGGSNARSDLKRRRLHLQSQDADDMDFDQQKPSTKKQLAMALSGALGFKRFVVGVGSGVIGTLGRMGGKPLDSVDTAEDQDDSDSDTDEGRESSEGAQGHNADLLKMLSSKGSQTEH